MSMSTDEEESATEKESLDLYARLREGDKSALGPLRERHDAFLVAYARRQLGTKDHDIAHDVAQRVWVRVVNNETGFTGGCKFRNWLYSIATNVCREERRDRKKRQAERIDNVGARSSDYERAELENDMAKALGTLDALERELIRMRVNEGMTVK